MHPLLLRIPLQPPFTNLMLVSEAPGPVEGTLQLPLHHVVSTKEPSPHWNEAPTSEPLNQTSDAITL